LQRWLDLQKLDRLARHIAETIDNGKYDVVFAQPCMWTQAPLVLRYLHTPAIYYCHEPPRYLYETFSSNRVQGLRDALNKIDPFIFLYRSTAQNFDRISTCSAKLVLVNSKFIQERVKQIYGINPVISYHGVDTDLFCPTLHNGSKRYVLSVGALQPHKGYDFLIESFNYIDKTLRPSLHLIGNMENPGFQNYLQVLAEKNNVDLHIELGLDQDTLVQRYNEAALVAYAPYNEPFGLVPLEAMACAKPVVGICEGGVMETVVNKQTGFLIERDPEKFGRAIQFLLENPNLAEQYGKNGRKHVLDHWSWAKSADELAQHMNSLI